MARDIYELIQREYGFDHMDSGPPVVGVAAATEVQFLRQDPARVAFVFVNLSANVLMILPTNGVVAATRGIPVPAGGIAAFNWRDDLVLPAREWFVLGTAAAEAWMVVSVSIDEPQPERTA